MQKNRWTVMNRMITARSFFASGVIEGMIYVAGGNSSDLFELDSAEVLDPVKGNWRRIANMGTNMASYDAAVLDGKLLVTEGWLWPFFFAPRGQIYDPRTDKWENMAFGLREDIDSWETIEGPPLPEQIYKPFAVSACDCKIYVVGRNLHVVVGHISRLQPKGICEKKWSFSVRWHAVDPPDSFCDLTPSSSQMWP
ncbi:hypothetical protein OIU84_010385 [Salix udensis]|uniref:Uncharacterized protein n=1 Tax=Salix udensis TaxID=889485 RepID=A0AAD6NVP9_9ROSI|nr:hypothetical protein OIU84_010385 [Salix udensis]